MSNLLHVYRLLNDACRLLDDSKDHAIAAYVGLAMALIEDKYGILPSDAQANVDGSDNGLGEMPPPAALPGNSGSWA